VTCVSQAVMVDQTLYLSGCIGLDPTTANLVPGGIEPEAEQVCTLVLYACLNVTYCWNMCSEQALAASTNVVFVRLVRMFMDIMS